MAETDLQSQLEARIQQAGLLPYFDKEESRFVNLEESFLVELVARDSTKLSDFGRIVEGLKAENPEVRTLVRARWEVEDVGQPIQANDIPGTGAPRMAVQYPVRLSSGRGVAQAWVEVTTLASMAFRHHSVDEKSIVREFVLEQLSKGGASYWDPERFLRLEISANMADYIVSRRPVKKQ